MKTLTLEEMEQMKADLNGSEKVKQETRLITQTCRKCDETKKGYEFGFIKRTLKRDTMCKKCKKEQAQIAKSKRIAEGRDW